MQLKPCPFCARTDLLGFEPGDNRFLTVKCRACGCSGPVRTALTPDEAAARWNHRPLVK